MEWCDDNGGSELTSFYVFVEAAVNYYFKNVKKLVKRKNTHESNNNLAIDRLTGSMMPLSCIHFLKIFSEQNLTES